MNADIFRKYDIRGVASEELTDEVVENIGHAYADRLREREDFSESDGLTVAIGRDVRRSSDRIFEALVEGITAGGVNTLDVGVVPTPLVYFATHHFDLDGSVQITGSHNPSEYNGLKMMEGHQPLFGDGIEELERRIRAGELSDDASRGEATSRADLIETYIDWVVEDIEPGEASVKVAMDCGNGAAGVVAPDLVEAVFGERPVELYTEPNPDFPNHHPDPTVEENLEDLRETVRDQNCDVGVAYDGDGDRLGVVDADGTIIWGDQLLIALSRAVLAERPGATIIGEVKCSKTLFDDIRDRGGEPVMGRVGHSLIKNEIHETGAALAGEMSGHIFFNDRYFGFDDALYATCRLLELMSKTGETLGEMLADVPETFATPEIRRDCNEAIKFEVADRVAAYFADRNYTVNTVDGARITFENGWGLVRASNTQPKLVLRAEATSEAERDEYLELLEDAIADVKQGMGNRK